MGSSTGRANPKTLKFTFVTSSLSTQSLNSEIKQRLVGLESE